MAEKNGTEARVMYTGWRQPDDANYEKPNYKRSQWIKHSAAAPNPRLRTMDGYPVLAHGDSGGGGCCAVQ